MRWRRQESANDLSGLVDAFTGQPLNPALGLYQCECGRYYHNSSYEAIQRDRAGHCMACSSTSIHTVSAGASRPSAGASRPSPAAFPFARIVGGGIILACLVGLLIFWYLAYEKEDAARKEQARTQALRDEAERNAKRTRVEQWIVGAWSDGSSRLNIAKDGARFRAEYPSSMGLQVLSGELQPDNQLRLGNVKQLGKLVNPLTYYQGDFGQEAWIELGADGNFVIARFSQGTGGRSLVMNRVTANPGPQVSVASPPKPPPPQSPPAPVPQPKPPPDVTENARSGAKNQTFQTETPLAGRPPAPVIQPKPAEGMAENTRSGTEEQTVQSRQTKDSLSSSGAPSSGPPPVAVVRELLKKARVAWVARQYQEALGYCDDAITRDPQSAQAWTIKGGVYNSWRRYADAIAACDAAIGIDANLADAWFTKASSEQSSGNSQGALSSYHKFREIVKASDARVPLVEDRIRKLEGR